MFKGSFVALVTPMHEDGTIDYLSLQKLVEFHIKNGTHGIVSVGTTGESATLPFNEHFDVVKKTVEFADGKIDVLAGSGANSTAEATYISESLANTGVKGFLSVVPYYNKPQQTGMLAHFDAVANSTDLPVLLYNVPSRTVADLLPETVAQLAQHKNIVGIKDATGDIKRLRAMQRMVDQDFVFLSGDDATSIDFMCAGGHGVISVTANLVPQQMAQICELASSGEHAQARVIDAQIAALHHSLFIEPNPVMPKWALHRMGLCETAFLRLPLVESELASQKQLEQVMLETRVLN